MNGQSGEAPVPLARKIARLVEERGWNQEDFARMSRLARHTVRRILLSDGNVRLHNTTIQACAGALGLTVSELRDTPLGRLLARVGAPSARDGDAARKRYDLATQPELRAWVDRNPDRAAGLSNTEFDELLSLQGTGGPLTPCGVEHYAGEIERKRKLIEMVHAVAGTEYIELLEQLVRVLYEKVQPYPDRA